MIFPVTLKRIQFVTMSSFFNSILFKAVFSYVIAVHIFNETFF